MTADQKNSILYQSQVWVANTGYAIMQKEQYSQSCDREYDLAFKILNYQLVLLDSQVNDNLTVKEQEYIYRCIQDSLNLQNYPVAPLAFSMVESVDILIGQQGPAGIPGAPGVNGTDANIDVITDDSELQVVESVVLGVKTFTIRNFKYAAPLITISLDEASIPDQTPGSHVVESGVVIANLPLYVNITKKRDTVLSSVLTSPGALAAAYAAEVDLTEINTNGSQAIVLNLANVSVNTTYTVNVGDGTSTPAVSTSITFVKPFLYGATAALSPSHYTDLQKLIQTVGNKSIAFNDTVKYFWFGFPVSSGALSQILDQNGFDVTSAFTVLNPVSVTSTGLNVNWTEDYVFYRTTLQTTIVGTYTFKF